MNDLIDRQGAIDTAAEYEKQLCEILGDENELVEVVKILKHRLISLPSAQPEPCDAISRADAIRVASGYCHPANVAQELAKLPSVQPVIYCRDCIHYDGRPCGIVDWWNMDDDFCSRAERRTDETD